ncbi:MAG TPA: UDP-3-O-(3-hydroxymyristoyl)glucosamine N-acyltransferase [Fermentimonas sp.]|nr:UDP-3-O-(3-hydroxymyristoyl)glucosamine N-acyltransferase [Fermentimonas sp.]
MIYDVGDIQDLFSKDDIVIGKMDNYFSRVGDIKNIRSDTLDWVNIANPNPIKYIVRSTSRFMICPKINELDIPPDVLKRKTLILTQNPNLLFARVARKIFSPEQQYGIHQTTIIHSDAVINQNIFIGPYTYIGKAIIETGTVINGNCFIDNDVSIGKNSLIKAGARLGQSGFGFVRNEEGEFEEFPQLGNLVIGDNVEIGSNTCIDRGSLSTTLIESGVKINSNCHIAHNSKIGRNSFIGSNVTISGSVIIGQGCWIAPSVTIRDHLIIGDYCIIGIGSVVTKSIPDNEVWYGVPAKYIRDQGKLAKRK